MKYTFKYNLTPNDKFLSSLNFRRMSKTFYFDILFTVLAIGATIYTIVTGRFASFSIIRKLLLILCCILFPVIQPIILYIKSFNKNTIFDEFTLSFDDDYIYISAKNDKTQVKYSEVYNFIKFKNMIIIMYDSIHGQIMPDRIFNGKKEEFYQFVYNKIMLARENIKNNE